MPKNSLRQLFLLDPRLTFLNHGSFGACPRPVFEAYQRYQLELERDPVEFLARERGFPARLDAAKARLAEYVGAGAGDLLFVPNATTGIGTVARSLRLERGDEVLASDEEYGGVDVLWRFVCERAGARYVTRPVAELAAAIGPQTRIVCVSHISSPTARILPVADVVAAARAAGALSIIDGAHAPGHIALDVRALDADVYAGNCHKWLSAPKGAGFLHVAPRAQELVEPLVVSWDWDEDDAGFAGRRRWHGTRDPAAYLAVPDAIDFQRAHDWDAVRERCHALAVRAQHELTALGFEPLEGEFGQMVALRVPAGTDGAALARRLREEFLIEVAVQRDLFRVSFQGYNDERDLERLLGALGAIL